MSRMRSSMSKKNKWYIDPERYLELKHFCLQYNKWNDAVHDYNLYRMSRTCMSGHVDKRIAESDPTADFVINYQENNFRRILIEGCALEANRSIHDWIVMGVANGLGYEQLKARGLACGKDYYYEAYHKFFYILDKRRK